MCEFITLVYKLCFLTLILLYNQVTRAYVWNNAQEAVGVIAVHICDFVGREDQHHIESC